MAQPNYYNQIIDLIASAIKNYLNSKPTPKVEQNRMHAASRQIRRLVNQEVKRLTAMLTAAHPTITVDWPLPPLSQEICDKVEEELLFRGYDVFHQSTEQEQKVVISLFASNSDQPTKSTKSNQDVGSFLSTMMSNLTKNFPTVDKDQAQNMQDSVLNLVNKVTCPVVKTDPAKPPESDLPNLNLTTLLENIFSAVGNNSLTHIPMKSNFSLINSLFYIFTKCISQERQDKLLTFQVKPLDEQTRFSALMHLTYIKRGLESIDNQEFKSQLAKVKDNSVGNKFVGLLFDFALSIYDFMVNYFKGPNGLILNINNFLDQFVPKLNLEIAIMAENITPEDSLEDIYQAEIIGIGQLISIFNLLTKSTDQGIYVNEVYRRVRRINNTDNHSKLDSTLQSVLQEMINEVKDSPTKQDNPSTEQDNPSTEQDNPLTKQDSSSTKPKEETSIDQLLEKAQSLAVDSVEPTDEKLSEEESWTQVDD